MSKLILFVVIGIIIYLFFIKSKEIKDENKDEFIQCKRCKTFVLKSEMKEKDGKLYCKECYENS